MFQCLYNHLEDLGEIKDLGVIKALEVSSREAGEVNSKVVGVEINKEEGGEDKDKDEVDGEDSKAGDKEAGEVDS